MQKLVLLIASLFVLSTVSPAWANVPTDHVYFGHFLSMRRSIGLGGGMGGMIGVPSSLSFGSHGGGQGSTCLFAASDLPEWDFDVLAGFGILNAEHLGMQGFKYEADVTTLHAGVQARKDRWTVRGIVHYEDMEGKGVNTTGLDSDNTGFLFQPSYRVLNQEENGVNLDVDGIFDVSHTSHSQATPSAWYIRPGVQAAVSRLTKAGLVQGTYAFQQSRNIDGDNELLSTREYINGHALALDYICRVSNILLGNIGISHITSDNVPAGTDDEFTDINLRLASARSGNVNINGGFFQAIDGRDTNGFDLQAVVGLK